jgi:hypothetical protein
MSKEVASITLEQLLTVTSGVGEDDTTHERELKSQDYIAEVVRQGTNARPGTEWHRLGSSVSHVWAISGPLRTASASHPRSATSARGLSARLQARRPRPFKLAVLL